MLVTLTAGNTWSGELDCEVTFRHPSAGELGDATVTIPRPHAALAVDDRGRPLYIDMNGGFMVTLAHETIGRFVGIADVPTTSLDAVTLAIMDIAIITTIRRVGNSTTFAAVPAGLIVAAAWREAFGGVGLAAIGLGAVTLSGPLIQSYEFSGQTLADVLGDMGAASGQEWRISDAGLLEWGGWLGEWYPNPICDDGDALQAQLGGTITDMALRVTARDALGREATMVTLQTQAGALWPAEVDGSA